MDSDHDYEEGLCIRYAFDLPPHPTRDFVLHLRRDTLALIHSPRATYPDWAALHYYQCPNCPLQTERFPRCPVAAGLVEVVEFFQDVWSFQEIAVEIAVGPRSIQMRTAVQNALSGLVGVYMVTSGCPVLDKLRPMVYSHLPFGSLEETMYRAVSMYSLAQVLRYRRGLKPDWDLSGLAKIYDEVGVVNRSFHRRLPVTGTKEAGRNALISLDCYAQYTSNRPFGNALDELEGVFQAYLNE